MSLVLGRRSIEAAADRPVTLRMRSDLIVRRRIIRGHTRFIIKDPITSRHHLLREEEYALLEMLDGRKTAAEMQIEFETRFRPKKLDMRRLQFLHGLFHRNGFVTADAQGQANPLTERRIAAERRSFREQFGNPLVIRLRGINPDVLLEKLDLWFGGLLSPVVFKWTFVFVFFSALVFFTDLLKWTPDLQELRSHLTAGNLILLLVVFASVKVLHEIAHGLTCKHFGGECNELGAMFLAFVPCLYCDVSDAWLIDDKWKRAATAAAGVWIEAVAAAVCVWIWRSSRPGLLHTLSFEVILVGGFGTLFVNANPLMRYDGYFVMSDLLDSPNLWERSRRRLRSLVRQYFFPMNRIADADAETGEASVGLAAFAAASITYQWIALAMILITITRLLVELRLDVAAAGLVGMTGLTILFQASNKVDQFMRHPAPMRGLSKRRAGFAAALIVLCLVTVFAVPLPRSIVVPFELQPHERSTVTVIVDGRLKACLPEGSRVKAGDVIAELYSPEHDLETARKRGKIAAQRARLESLESRRQSDDAAAAQIPSLKESIAGLESELARLSAVKESFTIRASRDGFIVASNRRVSAESEDSSDAGRSYEAVAERISGVETWSGTPLEPENRGCRLRPGETLCTIASGSKLDGITYLTQSQVELVGTGQAVTAVSSISPGHRMHGVVVEVAAASVSEVPAELAKTGRLPVKGYRSDRAESVAPMFPARIEFSDDEPAAVAQATGSMRIHVRPATLAERLSRFISESFTLSPVRN